jgi:indolepyruvate decarboxylase
MSDEQEPNGIDRRDLMMLAAAAGLAAAPLSGALAQPAGARVDVADHIALRLIELGCRALFGVPGATCDAFIEAAIARGMKPVITASDLEAGYAADAYARRRGIGAVTVTYGVGTLSLIAAVAGAYTERSPLVVINGGPSALDLSVLRDDNTLFSHSLGAVPPRRPGQAVADDALLGDLAIFRRATAYAVRITRAADAARQIDEALTICRREQRPVYIEVPKDVWTQRAGSLPLAPLPAPGDGAAGNEDVLAGRLIGRLRTARKPVLLIGEQVGRYCLTDPVTRLTGKLAVPWVTTFLAKAVLPERGAHFAGVYDGPSAPPFVERLLLDADLIVALGCTMGRQYRDLVQAKIAVLVQAADGAFRDGRNQAVAASLPRLVSALNAAPWTPDPAHLTGRVLTDRSFAGRRASHRPGPAGLPGPGLSHVAVMETVSAFLDPSFVVIGDTSLSQYPAADLDIPAAGGFLSNAIWNAIGYSPAAAVGVGVAEQEAGTGRRPLVICGDGGFQMTAQALSTLARQNVRAIVLVLDNALYAIEQLVVESIKGISPDSDRSYFRNASVNPSEHLNLARWDYVGLARSMGFASAVAVDTPQALADALRQFAAASGPALISVRMNPRNLPPELLS